ncbi:hypothetical protein RUND412_006631 [Rhizina undulata]
MPDLSRLPGRISTGVSFLALVILSVPLAFDIGGRDGGLTYSLSLATFYFIFSTLRLITPSSPSWKPLRILLTLTGVLQYVVVIPGLLIFALNKFPENYYEVASSGVGGKSSSGVEGEPKTIGEQLTIVPWYHFLKYSTPVFQLCEGFCTLLVIQAVGQISRWLVNRNKSDSWMIALLIMSGSVFSTAFYFLYRITNFPQIKNIDATLIGAAVTCAIFLCAYGVNSGKGNPVESSMLFSYIVLCLYQIFTDYGPSLPPMAADKPEFPPFPPLIMDSYTTLVSSMSAFIPTFLRQIGTFVVSAYSTVTPFVIISLAYRILVFYASTRIIPAVRESGGRGLGQGPNIKDKEVMSRIAAAFEWYSPSILIAVYTHLLMQHFEITHEDGYTAENGAPWAPGLPVRGQVWRWVNIGATMALYAFELIQGDQGGEALTSHWKTD